MCGIVCGALSMWACVDVTRRPTAVTGGRTTSAQQGSTPRDFVWTLGEGGVIGAAEVYERECVCVCVEQGARGGQGSRREP